MKSKGIKSFVRSNKVIKEVENISRGRLRDFGEEMVAEAKSDCPVDTGNLRDSIDMTDVSPLRFRVHYGGEAAAYAPFIEFGTKNMFGQLVLGNAFDHAKRVIGGQPWE